MGKTSSALSHFREISQRHRASGNVSCLTPASHRRRPPLVLVLSQCNTESIWKLAISIIELYGGNIRLHAATDDYDHVMEIGDKFLLKYLNQKLFVHKVDLRSEASIDEFWREIFQMEPMIDAFVLHMDQMCVKSIDDTGTSLISTTFDTNLFAPMLLIKTLLPTMKAHKKGKIICLTTVGGTIGIPLHSVYCSAKFALEGLLESLASECIKHSISISMVQTNLDKEQSSPKFIVELPHNTCTSLCDDIEDKNKTQDATINWLDDEGLLKELNVKKISRTIKDIIDSKDPDFRYIICRRCKAVLKEKLKDLHGCLTIKEVSKFFLNVDVE